MSKEIIIFLKNIYRGFENFWYFRREIWNFRWWDYQYNLDLFSRSIEMSARETKKRGMAENSKERAEQMFSFVSNVKKLQASEFIADAEQILNHKISDFTIVDGKFSHVDPEYDPEKESRVFALSINLEEKNWDDMWRNIKENMQSWWD